MQGCDDSRSRDALCGASIEAAGGTSELVISGAAVAGNTAERGGLVYVAIGGHATLSAVDATGCAATELVSR